MRQKILNNDVPQLLEKLEKISQDIKYITESKPHRINFINDIDHSWHVTEGSVFEGLTACAAEDQGFFNQLSRSAERGVDFIDELGRKWDFKTASSFREGVPQYRFNLEEVSMQIEKALIKSKNVIVDISDLNEFDLNLLNSKLINILEASNNKTKIININKTNKLASKIIR